MRPLPRLLPALLAAFPSCLSFAQQPKLPPNADADAIMRQVAIHQDQSEAERAHYVYVQHARVLSRKGKTVRCEEITDSRVIPNGTGSHQELLKLDGKLLGKDKKYLIYTTLPRAEDMGESTIEADDKDLRITVGDEATDRDLVEHMRNNLTNDQSKDGIGARLFPLTSKTQALYAFHLVGREQVNGREVFHIAFEPHDKAEYGWKGDAFIDTTAYQPVLVHTAMSRKIPFAVRTVLGTSLPGLGFNVAYAPQPGGIWFPISFGTEFKLKVLFFFTREITITAANHDFEKTHVSSTIVPASPAKEN